MEGTIMGASTILAIALVWFAASFWYGKTIAKATKPIGEVFSAASMHATVYAADIKNSAIKKAATLDVDTKSASTAREKLAIINTFSFDLDEDEEVAVVTKKKVATPAV